MKQYNIDQINDMIPIVDYSSQAVAEYEQGMGDRIDEYTEQFERDYSVALTGADSDDIGGLIVYVRDSKPVAVYDYENFVGWILN